MTDYDSPWKEALDSFFEACLAFFFPQAHAEIDWTRGYQMMDKELQQIEPDAEHGRRVVDQLVKVWLKSGEERWLLVHIEVQTWREGDFPRRMYVYHCRLEWQEKTLNLQCPNHYKGLRRCFRSR